MRSIIDSNRTRRCVCCDSIVAIHGTERARSVPVRTRRAVTEVHPRMQGRSDRHQMPSSSLGESSFETKQIPSGTRPAIVRSRPMITTGTPSLRNSWTTGSTCSVSLPVSAAHVHHTASSGTSSGGRLERRSRTVRAMCLKARRTAQPGCGLSLCNNSQRIASLRSTPTRVPPNGCASKPDSRAHRSREPLPLLRNMVVRSLEDVSVPVLLRPTCGRTGRCPQERPGRALAAVPSG